MFHANFWEENNTLTLLLLLCVCVCSFLKERLGLIKLGHLFYP